jgi:hypothetical protein
LIDRRAANESYATAAATDRFLAARRWHNHEQSSASNIFVQLFLLAVRQ